MSDSEEGEKKVGQIDLPGLFEAEAVEYMAAVTRGRLLHRTRNIRDSGAPLEALFRKNWQSRLPSTFQMEQGYLFDATSACTPQIDAMIVSADDAHTLMQTSDGAKYLPFSSAWVIFEIKNSGTNIGHSLDQLNKVQMSIQGMHRKHLPAVSAQAPVRDPMSVLVIGDSKGTTLADLRQWYGRQDIKPPSYVVLIDRGVMVTCRSPVLDLMSGEDESISFHDHRQGGPQYLCVPRGLGETRGQVLLWLYFSVVAHLNWHMGNKSSTTYFPAVAERMFPLQRVMPLLESTDWADFEKAQAEIGSDWG